MSMIFLIIVVAITVEGLVEYAKSAYKAAKQQEGGAGWTLVIQLGALVAAVFLCLVFKADLYSYLGISIPAGFWWLGCALTGIFASRGSNYVSDLIGRLRSGGGIIEATSGMELVNEDDAKVYEPPSETV